jgi:hypothetical protein
MFGSRELPSAWLHATQGQAILVVVQRRLRFHDWMGDAGQTEGPGNRFPAPAFFRSYPHAGVISMDIRPLLPISL